MNDNQKRAFICILCAVVNLPFVLKGSVINLASMIYCTIMAIVCWNQYK